MKTKNQIKLEKVKEILDNKGIFYTEHPNGQLKIDSVNLWVTTEKFYDEKTKYKGQGINAFLSYISNNSKI